MIRQCRQNDLEAMCGIINDAARAYRGHIPADRGNEPSMSREHVQQEIDDGVVFWGCEESDGLVGVTGIQPVQDVTRIRHACVRTAHRGTGIGGRLLSELKQMTSGPTLAGRGRPLSGRSGSPKSTGTGS